ncbi:MAG: mannose-1-phosphate guanylyltransferase [Bacteroidia bacterium]
MKNHYAIIMAGGVGSRFWPMSTSQHPKQFLDVLGSGETLIQQTYNRLLKICPKKNIFVVTSAQYDKLTKTQLPDLPSENILLEPSRKNTAPCIIYASYKIQKLNPKAVTIVAPSDHLITKEDTFVKAMKSCLKKASAEDSLITLGIKPTRPDTGYGYIQYMDSDLKEKDKRMYKVKTFTEKPSAEMAKVLFESGDFLWNSGIFIWRTSVLIKAAETLDPELANVFKEGVNLYNTPEESAFVNKAYNICKNISIDYSIMEKAPNVYVRSSIIGWSDLGTWGSLYEHLKHDKQGNATIGKNIMMYDSKNCIVQMPKDKLVVLQGLEDYIIVESDDTLLICKKADEQLIRNFVNDVKVKKGEKYV